MCVLHQSTTLDDESKRKPVLKAAYMSSDESAIEYDDLNSDSNSEEDQNKSSTAKKLICHKLPWWNVEFE